MFLVELIASSFFYLISKQARPVAVVSAFLFLHKLTSIYRQNWSCEKIPKSQNSDKATSFSSVVVNIASRLQKVSYGKPLLNKSRCLNTMKSFLAFKVISTWIFVYFQKGFTMKLWQNNQFTTAILFCFIFTA